MAEARTLFDKIWDAHVVEQQDDGTCLLYIDRHLVHEVTSPQAFEGCARPAAGCAGPMPPLRSPTTTCRPPTAAKGIAEPQTSRLQVETLSRTARDFGIELFDVEDIRQGIVHVIGPEQGFTLPGTTIVCGDSHTSTHGAFGALAFGIGTSEVEHVLATQTLLQKRPLRHAGQRRGRPCRFGRHRQGRDPGDHRQDRHRGRHRPRHRVCRRGDPRPVDGGAHDGLQHVDRGGRPGRPDRARRDHLRLSPGPADGAQGGRLRAGGGAAGGPCPRMPAPATTRR